MVNYPRDYIILALRLCLFRSKVFFFDSDFVVVSFFLANRAIVNGHWPDDVADSAGECYFFVTDSRSAFYSYY